MKNNTFWSLTLAFLILPLQFFAIQPSVDTIIQEQQMENGSYTLVVEGFDWGPAANRVILSMGETVNETTSGNYAVTVKRSAAGVEMGEQEAGGERPVIYSYVSDKNGNRVSEGSYVTLVLFVSPDHVLGSPIKYIFKEGRGANEWIDYQLIIKDNSTNRIWDKETNRILPIIDDFNLKGSYTYKNQTLTYAFFSPKQAKKNSPLIIWLHGGGEGGTDTSIPLTANKATNYASEEIQQIMGGAFVLVPQTPTFWMQSADGNYTRGDRNDIYNEALIGLIKQFVKDHPDIDQDRIYIGGCSNGGYMSLKLLLLYPDYFAAAYISALAYQSSYITDEQIQSIKDIPIWFVHSKDDPVTKANETVVPLYQRLIQAGAKKVHFSYYEHVTDITGLYGGDNYRYSGHWSWIYSHANTARLDFDGSPVVLDNRPVTIMEWMAAQQR
ncbi:alpha/beta hydrolase-fold protein [Poritiphilus flavus]|uniref:Prolyl oligopeptidase family serine peptidase n=1 Tax=Poritiphilus flavus TaxID=2697053 RepID=A0A6L9E7H0_9FLAO|nr:alpha/beta hydrolase-fold protein [Poritiphilus flavus]NAS10584.1 prolyl oligopeptidase family serine peptidase [Poritiphilus flavus]